MASSRIARYATEVAPAQFVTVMRQRANKMMDTIQEEEIHASGTSTSISTSTSTSKSNGSLVSFSPGSPSVASSDGENSPRKSGRSGWFLKGVHKSISIFGH